MALPPDLKFAAALALLGVVMLSLPPGAAFWLGVLLVLAALTYAQLEGQTQGHTLIGDVTKLFFGEEKAK